MFMLDPTMIIGIAILLVIIVLMIINLAGRKKEEKDSLQDRLNEMYGRKQAASIFDLKEQPRSLRRMSRKTSLVSQNNAAPAAGSPFDRDIGKKYGLPGSIDVLKEQGGTLASAFSSKGRTLGNFSSSRTTSMGRPVGQTQPTFRQTPGQVPASAGRNRKASQGGKKWAVIALIWFIWILFAVIGAFEK